MQCTGLPFYHLMIGALESWLCTVTGFHAICMQPNADLLVLRKYHEA